MTTTDNAISPPAVSCNSPQPRHLPQGALRADDGSVTWRIWAPRHEELTLVLHDGATRRELPMTAQPFGYFEHREEQVPEGVRYTYKLSSGAERPDPSSRWQPDGVHEPSALVSPQQFQWSDAGWRGVELDDLVIYELHIGTFTPQGTFEAAIDRLDDLRQLGITAIEIMPIAQFPGARNWGYDGAYLYAAQSTYGGPHGLQRLVDAAHARGIAVILDVVYNHFGPEGNYLGEYGHYYTDHYQTPWGFAINYDGPESDAVRQFVIDNACAWVRDFHIDGLRLDAVHAIYDLSAKHLLAELQENVQQVAAAQSRRVLVISETSQNDMRYVNPAEQGGFGLDATWTDDFHHSVHALLTGERDGYYLDFGHPDQIAKSFSHVFVYDGCYSPYRRRRHGGPTLDANRNQFILCVQNHDQVGNRAWGERFGALLPPAAQRLAAGLLLISPCVPMLFMGEEYGETRPFQFFTSFSDPALVEAVRKGRRAEFAGLQFQWGTEIPDPHAQETFDSAILSWDWSQGSVHGGIREMYGQLLTARRTWPELRDKKHTSAEVVCSTAPAVDDAPQSAVLIVRRGAEPALIAYANLSDQPQARPVEVLGRRTLLLSTEAERFGGARGNSSDQSQLFPYELCIYGVAR